MSNNPSEISKGKNQNTTNKIAAEFGKYADSYHKQAEIPKKVAQGLIASLEPWKDILPPGPILEVGCGTGFLTKLLLKQFPKREFLITDASPEMLEFCKKQIEEEGLLRENVSFQLFDADTDEFEEYRFSMIISNFVAHWLKDTSIGLEKLTKSIKKGGLLLSSFLGEKSLPEWYVKCLGLGLPHTANPLPNVERVGTALSLGPLQIDYYENNLFSEFDSSLELFRHIKGVGAGYSKLRKSLSPKQFRLLIKHWDEQSGGNIKVKWHIVYLAAKKDFV